MSNRARAFASLAGVVLLAGAAGACRGSSHDLLITYFNGDYGLSVRYPASWRTDQAEQEGMWYRYFLGPPTGTQRKPAVSVTLFAGPLAMPLDEYAQKYLAGNLPSSSREEARAGARGKAYRFASSGGATRHSLLLLQEAQRVYGLYSQADAPLFEALRAWRRQRAAEQHVPPYVIFHDATLLAIARQRPASADALAKVSGVGQMKLERYGADVLEIVRES